MHHIWPTSRRLWFNYPNNILCRSRWPYRRRQPFESRWGNECLLYLLIAQVAMSARSPKCMFVCVCLYIYIYIYTHIHIYTDTHTHTHTHTHIYIYIYCVCDQDTSKRVGLCLSLAIAPQNTINNILWRISPKYPDRFWGQNTCIVSECWVFYVQM